MKFLAVVAVALCAAVATAEPEADAALLYAGYGYSPLSYGYGYAPYGYGYYGYPYSYGYAGHLIGKRDAEADAGLVSYAYAPYTYAYAPYTYAYAPYTYAVAPAAASYQAISTPFSYSSVSQIHKREAEADASIALAYAPYAYTYAPGIAAHPGVATSYEHRSPQGLGALYRPYGFYGYYL